MAERTTLTTKTAAHVKLDLYSKGSAATDWTTLMSLHLTM